MIKVGSRRIIFSETLLCPYDEVLDLKINVPKEADPWHIRVIFIEKGDSEDEVKAKPRMLLEIENDIATIKFINWSNAFGATLTEPSRIATSEVGEPITLLAEVAKLTSLYRVHLQIMIEDNLNE